MVELGLCSAKCRNKNVCFFVKPYFICNHCVCYNVYVKFKHCIRCGERRQRYIMNDNTEEVTLDHSILNKTFCKCVR